MPDAPAPYFVHFSADPVPRTVDHSQAEPGPANGSHRAGHTQVRVTPRMTVRWEDGGPGAGGRFALWVVSANIYFRLQDYVVAISSDYAVGSCAYRTTLGHELESHVRRPMRIFFSYRAEMLRLLRGAPLPTQASPVFVTRDDAEAEQERLVAPARAAVAQVRDLIGAALRADRNREDGAHAYSLVYNRCTPQQWADGR